jgi:basic membrane protein A
MSKKLYVVLSVLVLASMLLAACGGGTTTSGKPDCSKDDVFCVGLVTDVGKIDDKSFNQSTWEGVQQAGKDLGATVQYIETTDSKDYAKNIATFADAKYDVIVTVGFALGESTIAAAKQYTGIKFIGVDQSQSEKIPNLVGLVFPEDQAGYLVGALAAQMTKTNKLGAVLGTDAVPAVWRFGEGFRAGALAINPDVELNVVYHNDVGFDKTFSDPEWGKTTALSMIDKGVDIIFGAGGKTGNGALLGAAEKGVYCIGVDTDQYYTVPEAQKYLLSSAMKLLTPGTFDLIKMAKEGTFPAGGDYMGKAGYAPFHDLDSVVPAEVKTKMEELAKGLADGTIATNVAPTKPQ